MNPPNSQIEGALFEALKNHCPSIKNLCSFNPSITFKDLMTDRSYLDEKLNLFVWAILRYEPRFGNEFLDHQFFPVETKCKKILESLHMVSLIDINDFGCDKLVSPSSDRSYREQVHILNDMTRLLKLHEQFIPIRGVAKSSSYDENLAFEFNNLAMMQTSSSSDAAAAAAASSQFMTPGDEAALMRKIQVLDDPAFLSDFRRLLQLGAASLVPPEHSRVIKIINENTEYMKDLSLTKSTRRDEIMSYVDSKLSGMHLNDVNNYFSTTTTATAPTNGANMNSGGAESIKSLELDLSNFRADLKQVNSSLKARVSDLTSSTTTTTAFTASQSNQHLVESNLGRNFYDFSQKKASLDKLTKCFTDWSLFIETQMSKQKEYAKSESMIADNDDEATKVNNQQQQDGGGTFDLSQHVDKYLSLLGEEASFKRSEAKMADELLF